MHQAIHPVYLVEPPLQLAVLQIVRRDLAGVISPPAGTDPYITAKDAIGLLAMHDLTLAARYASTVLLMREGRVVAAGAPSDVFTRRTIAAVYCIDAELLTASSGHTAIVPLGPAHQSPNRPCI